MPFDLDPVELVFLLLVVLALGMFLRAVLRQRSAVAPPETRLSRPAPAI